MKRVPTAEWLYEHLVMLYEPFYATNDPAHRIGHVRGVTDLALELNDKFNLGQNRLAIVAAGLTHDLFNNNRKEHHNLAAEYILHNCIEWLQMFSDKRRSLIAAAVREHRASYKGEYSTLLSELIATADRGAPNYEQTVMRSYGYTLHQIKSTEDVDGAVINLLPVAANVCAHLVDKFGVNGYCKYPPLYSLVFKDDLLAYQEKCDNTTVEDVLTIAANC